jgi:predicted Zn-dependent protease
MPSTDNQDANYRAELHAAIDLSDQGKYKKALKALARLVKNFPEETQPRFERAMTLLNLDRDAEALADLQHVLARRPDYPGARNWCAIAQAGRGKPMLAGETKLLALTRLSPDAWAANGQA